MKRWSRALIVVVSCSLVLAAGCDDKKSRTTTRTNVEGQSYLLSSDDFDLETVMGLIKDDKVKGAEELEKAINDDSGINNVDIDRDEKIDYVMVKEGRDGEALLLDFVAIPSSTEKEDEAETVASVRFTRDTQTSQVHVEGGYPSYVDGHHHHYYSYHHRHGLSVGEALFIAWLFTPSRPLFYRPYSMGFYSPRPVYSSSSLASTRTSYRTSKSVGPVQKSARPASYKIASAQKAPSKWRQQATAKGGSLSSKRGSMKGFEARDSSKAKKSATGFGASKSSSGSAWGGKKSSGSSVWGGSSGSSGSKKSSFGGSSGSKSSWGSSSGSRSGSRSSSRSSFGGRRRR